MATKGFKKSTFSIISGCIVFTSVLILTQYLSYQEYLLSKEKEHEKLLQQADLINDKFQNILSNCIDAANTLTIICTEYGFPKDFNTVGQKVLSKAKYADAVGLVQDGVVTNVYPLRGNQGIVGGNKLSNPTLFQELHEATKKEGIPDKKDIESEIKQM